MDKVEYLDVLDEDGSIVGKALRSEVHKKGLWHRAAHVWIINDDNEILIQKRSSEKENHPNAWDISSAGQVISGKSSLETAIIEVQEELGVKIKQGELVQIGTLVTKTITNNGQYINNEFDDIFILKTHKRISDFIIQKEEVARIKYITLKELKEKVRENNPNFLPIRRAKTLIQYLENMK